MPHSARQAIAILAAALAGLSLSAPVRAQATYTYQGPLFTSVSGPPYPTALSGYVVLPTPIPPSTASSFGLVPQSFSFTDGVSFVTSSNYAAGESSFFLETDAQGGIAAWDLLMQSTTSGAYVDMKSSYDICCGFQESTTAFLFSGPVIGSYSGSVASSPGTWTVSLVPEAPSGALLGLGLLVLGCAARRCANRDA